MSRVELHPFRLSSATPSCIVFILASDAECGLGHGLQTLPIDRFSASEAGAIRALFDTGQGLLHRTNLREITVQNTDGEIPLFGELRFVHHVRSLLDGDVVAILQSAG